MSPMRRVLCAVLAAVGSTTVIGAVMADAAHAAGPTVTIPAGPFSDGQVISVSGTGFPSHSADPTGLQIIECSGTNTSHPTTPNSCDGTTVSPTEIDTNASGAFSTTYTISRLQSDAGAAVDCTSTASCVLWVGVDYNNQFNTNDGLSSAFFLKPAAPTITSDASTSASPGTPFDFLVRTTGDPIPTITESGSLPAGVTFTDDHNLNATLGGSTSATGSYPITITAHNTTSPDATQHFTLNVSSTLAVTSANSATFSTATTNTFTVTTSGSPTPTLTESGALPGGVSFTDNGNGTATLSGMPTATGAFPMTITAHNGVSPDATQSFTLTAGSPPTITSADSATFSTSSTNTFTVTTSGTPTSTLTESGALPGDVSFTDNGNGTATLSGMPTATGAFPMTITADNTTSPDATQHFTLNVSSTLAVTSANSATFSTATTNTFTVTTSGSPTPTLTESGVLPGA